MIDWKRYLKNKEEQLEKKKKKKFKLLTEKSGQIHWFQLSFAFESVALRLFVCLLIHLFIDSQWAFFLNSIRFNSLKLHAN